MHNVRTKTHHILDIVLDALFEIDLFGEEEAGEGTVADLAATHLLPHVYIALCGPSMTENDRKFIESGVKFMSEIIVGSFPELEAHEETQAVLVDELFARLLAYHRYENDDRGHGIEHADSDAEVAVGKAVSSKDVN